MSPLPRFLLQLTLGLTLPLSFAWSQTDSAASASPPTYADGALAEGDDASFQPDLPILDPDYTWPDPREAAAERGAFEVLPIALREVVDVALSRNLGLAIERLNPADARDNVEAARADFDPRLNFSGARRETRSPPSSTALDGAAVPETENRDYAGSVTQRIPLGTELTASATLNRSASNSAFATLNPAHFAELGLRIRQPLLRGLGAKVNLAPIVSARAALAGTQLRVRDEVLDVIAETERSYWVLSAAYARRALTLSNLRLAEALLNENVERERLGVALEIDVLQARASLATRLEELINAEKAIDEAEDRLRVQMGTLADAELNALAPSILPESTPPLPTFNEAIRAALIHDLETEAQYAEIARRLVDRETAESNTLPDLDLVLDGAWQGRDSSNIQAVEGVAQGAGYRWRAALELSFNWGLRQENARLRQADRAVDRAELRLADIRQVLLREVRTAWRDVSAGIERQRAAQVAVRLNAQLFEQERERFLNGLSAFRDVLEAQSDLDNARLRYLDATEQLINADVTLARLDGRLLDRHGFSWEDPHALPDQDYSDFSLDGLAPRRTRGVFSEPAASRTVTKKVPASP
ncbi:MAG: TolC family protein [Opitutales bacterium]